MQQAPQPEDHSRSFTVPAALVTLVACGVVVLFAASDIGYEIRDAYLRYRPLLGNQRFDPYRAAETRESHGMELFRRFSREVPPDAVVVALVTEMDVVGRASGAALEYLMYPRKFRRVHSVDQLLNVQQLDNRPVTHVVVAFPFGQSMPPIPFPEGTRVDTIGDNFLIAALPAAEAQP